MTLNDPYGDEDWENKAINGISAIVDNYGCFDIYYNNRLNCPLSLGLMGVINPWFASAGAGEYTGVPVILKTKKDYNNKAVSEWDMTSGATRENNSPIAVTAICTLDKNSESLEYMPASVRLCTAVGEYGDGIYKSVTLQTLAKTPYAGNIDEDMSDYIIGAYTSDKNSYTSGECGITFNNKSTLVYISNDIEIDTAKTTARITVIGDTSSNYNQYFNQT